MIYKDFKGLKLSQLGFGAMRLPVIGGDDSVIDVDHTERMVRYAMENGINYYDTAWGYHGEHSEEVMGKALLEYPRDSYYLATKFPGYDLGNMGKVKEIFEKQLEKTGHDYFDFYMFHNVCEVNVDPYLDPQYGILEYLLEQKKNGRIRHLGFSSHGELDVIKKFVEAYGPEMEFCQLQLNYMDWEFQAGKEKVDYLTEKGIPVWVMEPLRGGRLVSLDPAHEERLKSLRPDEEIYEWAFRFLQTIPQNVVILSGMSSEEQLRANVETFKEEKPLNEEEMEVLMGIAADMAAEGTVPCTACHYCVDHCPCGLDIPRLISLYNEHKVTTEAGLFGFIAPMAIEAIPKTRRPNVCLHCHACEKVCPQQIKISDVMEDFTARLG